MYVVTCTQCGFVLNEAMFNQPDWSHCPSCRSLLRVEVFPTLFNAPAPAQTAQSVVTEGEASCFYHPQKKAVVPCEACGRFLCALCDVELDGKHLCPACLESGKKKKTIHSLEDMRMLYNRQALVLAVLPLFITGLAAIYVAARYWKAPTSLVRPMRWAMPVALVLGTLQTLVFVIVIIAAVRS